jgi:hypothetical protein
METEVIRMVADALAHATIGVNAKLPGVPRDAGDPQPPLVTIADATRARWVARRAVVSGTRAVLPALAVSIYRPAEVDGEIETTDRDGTFDVMVEHIVENADSELATQHGGYVMRAVLCTLDWFHKNENVDMRTRNGVVLSVCTRRFIQPVWAPWESGPVVTTALIATYQVRDLTPFW